MADSDWELVSEVSQVRSFYDNETVASEEDPCAGCWDLSWMKEVYSPSPVFEPTLEQRLYQCNQKPGRFNRQKLFELGHKYSGLIGRTGRRRW